MFLFYVILSPPVMSQDGGQKWWHFVTPLLIRTLSLITIWQMFLLFSPSRVFYPKTKNRANPVCGKLRVKNSIQEFFFPRPKTTTIFFEEHSVIKPILNTLYAFSFWLRILHTGGCRLSIRVLLGIYGPLERLCDFFSSLKELAPVSFWINSRMWFILITLLDKIE